MIDKWDGRFMAMSEHVAGWSKDPSTKVGAVIADRKHRIVSVGFNGFPVGIEDDERLLDKPTKYDLVLHAEVNAILFASKPLEDCTLYVWPLSPCCRCAAQIIQSGIKRIVCPQLTCSSSWSSSCRKGFEMFRESKIIVETC